MSPQRTRTRSAETNIQGLLRFQQSFLHRLSEYFGKVGELAAAGSVEPGAWVETCVEGTVCVQASDTSTRNAVDLREWAADYDLAVRLQCHG